MNISKFQVVLISIFVVFIIVGVILFASYKGNSSVQTLGSIEIWGTFPKNTVDSLVREINLNRDSSISVNYTEISSVAFYKTYIEALASGKGPDAILIPQNTILKYEDKIIPIPYAVLSERDFKNTYIPEAELYLTANGSLALPFVSDPMVMYWNRDMFTNAGIANYPMYWDEFPNLINKISVKDVNSNIRRSVVAMGEFSNINHAREILSTLLFQSENPVTYRTSEGSVISAIGDGQYYGSKTSTPAINFFSQFSNPRDPLYSWNRSLPVSKSWFLSGSLATYFGMASEIFDIKGKNPNLNFDVSPMPQIRSGKIRATYGDMYGFSISKSSANQNNTYAVLQILTDPGALSALNKISYLPPVRRDMIASGSSDPYQQIFFDSALISKGWLDTDPNASNSILGNMIESITSGKVDPYTAIQSAGNELNLSLRGLNN